MNKSKMIALSLLIGFAITLPSILAISNNSKAMLEGSAATTGTYVTNAETFYGANNGFTNHVSPTDTGEQLLVNVHNLQNETHRYYNTYDDLKSVLLETDIDPDEPNNIILMYSNSSVKGKWNSIIWNREHVWPQSLGGWTTGLGPGADVLHLRPVNYTLNSTRNNNPYGEVAIHDSTTQFDITDCYLSSGIFEPGDRIKGDIAREIMYLYSHYDSKQGITPTYPYDLSITSIISTTAATEQAAWGIINKWNKIDPVDYQEIVRNNVGSSLIGTRNPFIDHPEYGDAIWGSGVGLSLSTSNFAIEKNTSKQIIASTQGNATLGEVTWSSSDENVATVTNGLVNGLKDGVAYITAASTINGVTYSNRSVAIIGTGWQAKGTGINGTVINPLTSSTVEVSDTTTQDSITFYQSSGSFQQLVSGNNFTLEIKNFKKEITSIDVLMHSNKTKGSMSVSITIGGVSIENETNQTFSHFYKQNYKPDEAERYCMSFVNLTFPNNTTTKTGDVVLTITGTINSVYYDRIVIGYAQEGKTEAVAWGSSFTSETASECSSLNVTLNTWNSLSLSYGNLSANAKDYFYNNANNPSEIEIYNSAKRYLYIINKYEYTPFIVDSKGNILSDNPYLKEISFDNQLIIQNKIITITLLVISITIISAGGIYCLSKRKRDAK